MLNEHFMNNLSLVLPLRTDMSQCYFAKDNTISRSYVNFRLPSKKRNIIFAVFVIILFIFEIPIAIKQTRYSNINDVQEWKRTQHAVSNEFNHEQLPIDDSGEKNWGKILVIATKLHKWYVL